MKNKILGFFSKKRMHYYHLSYFFSKKNVSGLGRIEYGTSIKIHKRGQIKIAECFITNLKNFDSCIILSWQPISEMLIESHDPFLNKKSVDDVNVSLGHKSELE